MRKPDPRKLDDALALEWQAVLTLQMWLLAIAGAIYFPYAFFIGHFTHSVIWTIGPFGSNNYLSINWNDQNALLFFWSTMLAFNLMSRTKRMAYRFTFHLWGIVLIITLFIQICLVLQGAFGGGKDFGGVGYSTFSFMVGICFIVSIGVQNYVTILLMQREADKNLLPIITIAAAADGTANKEKDVVIANAVAVADGRPSEKKVDLKFSDALNMVD